MNYFDSRFGKNKYGAKKVKFKGRTYQSKKEAEKAMELDQLLTEKKIIEIKPQHRFSLYVNGQRICNYFIDFRAVNKNGIVDYIEVKGYPTQLWKFKFQLTKALFDELTEGEDARLYLNNECVLQSFKNKKS